MTRALRRLGIAAITAMTLLGASPAQAISSIDFVWLDSGTPTLSTGLAGIFPGSVHTGAIVLTGDDPSPFYIAFSLLYDTFELDLLNARKYDVQIGPGPSIYPAAFYSNGGFWVEEANGFIGALNWHGHPFNRSPCGAGCVATLGTVKFRVAFLSENPAIFDRDIRLGLFNYHLDGVWDGTSTSLPVAFGTAAVPEPSEALLLIAGLGFLAYAGSRGSR